MQSGTIGVVKGYLNCIFRVLVQQEKSKVYSRKDLNRLSREVSGSLIKSLQWFDPANKKEISGYLQKAIEKSSSVQVKNNYRKVLKVLTD